MFGRDLMMATNRRALRPLRSHLHVGHLSNRNLLVVN